MTTLYAKDYAAADVPLTLGTLTPSNTVTDVISCKHSVHFLFAITISDIGTNVILRYEGSIDGDNWFNLNEDLMDSAYTANGTYYKAWAGEMPYLRVSLVSYVVGSPSITIKLSIARTS